MILHMILTCLFINFCSCIKFLAFFSQRKCLGINKFKITLKNNLSHIVSLHKGQLFKNIKSFQNYFIITHVDKVLNNYATICKSYYRQLFNTIFSTDTNFNLSNDCINTKNKQIYPFHKVLKIFQSNFIYSHQVLNPHFYKTPVKFRAITICYNTYTYSK